MAFYQGVDDTGVTYFIEATGPVTASVAAAGLVSGDNKIDVLGIAYQHDFTLVDLTLTNQFVVTSFDGYTYYGTGTDMTSFINRWITAFPTKVFFDCEIVSKTQFIFAQKRYIRLLNAHFGQANHKDYTPDKLDAVIAMAVTGQYTHIRDGYSAANDLMDFNAGTNIGGPNGLIAKAKASGIGVMLTLSLTGAGTTPVANILPSFTAALATSESITKAESDAVFARFDGRGFQAQTKNPDVNLWCVGSETENLDANLKIKSTATALGIVKLMPSPTPAADGGWIYTSTNSYNARYYPYYIAAIAGYNSGIKRANPNAITICNASFTHFGQIGLLMKESQRIYGQRIDWFGQDSYNTEEYGSDTSNYFKTKNGTTSNRGQWIDKPYKYFVEGGICDGVGLMEIGWNTSRSNPDGLTQTQWFDLVRKQYHADSRCLFVSEYEALSEPLARATSTDPAERNYGLLPATVSAMATWQYNPKPALENPYI